MTTRSERFTLECKLLGYNINNLPPTIDEFLTNPEYLGEVLGNSLFDYWRVKLREVFPDEIHSSKPYLMLTGGIGIGKSYVVRIVALYNLCRLLYLEDFRAFNIDTSKGLSFYFLHRKATDARSEFVEQIQSWIERSPFFSQHKQRINEILRYEAHGSTANRGNVIIGKDIFFSALSEVNFIKNQALANQLISDAFRRVMSRFSNVFPYFAHIVLDSSVGTFGSVTSQFAERYQDQIVMLGDCSWIVKAGRVPYFLQGSFLVYCGNAVSEAAIIPESYQPGETKYDPIPAEIQPVDGAKYSDALRRAYNAAYTTNGTELSTEQQLDILIRDGYVVKVPAELYLDFSRDLTRSIQDHIGKETVSSLDYFKDKTRLGKAMTVEQTHDDVIILPYDSGFEIPSELTQQIERLDKTRDYCVRVDLGIVSDLTGLAICSAIDPGDKKLFYEVGLCVGIGRKKGEETIISSVRDLIVAICKQIKVVSVTFDSYQSRGTIQDLKRLGINASVLSVDRDESPYFLLRELVLTERVKLPNNKLLTKELSELQATNKAPDHTELGSKDLADAVCGVVFDVNRRTSLLTAQSSTNDPLLVLAGSEPGDNDDGISKLLAKFGLRR